MSISRKELGKTEKGESITLYTLKNKNGIKASITDLGAIWTNLWAPDQNGKLEDVVLGYDTPDGLLQNAGHMGAVVGRNANRIGGAAFTLNGKTWKLAANDRKNNLHSGPDYLERRMYQVSCQEAEDKDEICLKLESPEGDQGYPGTLSIAVTYSLTNDNALHIRYELQAGAADTLANFTNHAYFNLAGHKAGSVLNQVLWIDADAITEGGPESIPHGTKLPVAGTAFDFRKPKAIGTDIDKKEQELLYAGGYDHNFCLNHKPFGAPSLCAAVYDPVSGRKMEVLTDMPGVQFYTGNFLNGTAVGKEGVRYEKHGGFALETQYYPNAINVPAFDQPVIHKGETKTFETIYRFGLTV